MKVIRITTEFRDDDGDKIAIVTVREGDSGTNPIAHVVHDSHFLHDAAKAAGREIRKAIKKMRS